MILSGATNLAGSCSDPFAALLIALDDGSKLSGLHRIVENDAGDDSDGAAGGAPNPDDAGAPGLEKP